MYACYLWTNLSRHPFNSRYCQRALDMLKESSASVCRAAKFAYVLERACTHDVKEVQCSGGVQVPVQLIQNNPLHPQDLRRRTATFAAGHQLFQRWDTLQNTYCISSLYLVGYMSMHVQFYIFT